MKAFLLCRLLPVIKVVAIPVSKLNVTADWLAHCFVYAMSQIQMLAQCLAVLTDF